MNAEVEGQQHVIPGYLPQRIAQRYEIRRVLGQGGFGSVFEAYDELEQRLVALKLVSSQDPDAHDSGKLDGSADDGNATSAVAQPALSQLTNDDRAQAFKDEFRLLTQLRHPNLASVFDFGRCDEAGGFFFTQELVRGEDLLAAFSGVRREQIVDMFIQLARALDYIHALGFVHGDIKPSNILVVETRERQQIAKLIDFGLARVLRERDVFPAADAEDSSDEGVMVLGTPGFAAPEKVQGHPADARSDIYSLAATIYTAIRGQRPFPGDTFRDALRIQRDWRPEFAGAVLQEAGPVVADLIGRMLESDPSKRPPSARSIVLELLRREPNRSGQRTAGQDDRRDFAGILVEHLPFVDRAHYRELLLDKAGEILRGAEHRRVGAASSSRLRARLLRTVIVRAPEGMGKKRLLDELRREIQLEDGLFVEGSCWNSDASTLGAFASIVAQLAAHLSQDSPVRERYNELIAAARGRLLTETMADQVTEFLLAAAGERPCVVHLSDLSRGQEATRFAFEKLCRAIDHNDVPMLLCATTEPHGKVAPMLHSLSREQLAEVWSIRPFSRREMEQLLKGVLGDAPILRDLTNLLDKLTGGHPLSFRETLRLLIEERILVRDGDGWTLRGASSAADELQRKMAERSEARLDMIGEAAWTIVSTLYLLEAPIKETQLVSLTELRAERFARTVEQLEGEGLITRTAVPGASLLALAHEAVREAIRRRCADSFDSTRIDLAARISTSQGHGAAFTYLRARLLDDAAAGLESVDALEEAINHLLEIHQPQLAGRLLERLIARLRRFGGTLGLRRLLGAKLKLLEHAPGALDDPRREASHYEAGVLVAELLGDVRAEALFWLGLVDRYAGTATQDTEVILERLDRARHAASRAADTVLGLRIANRRAEVLLGVGELEKAAQWSAEAMSIADREDACDADKSHVIGVRLRCLSLIGQLDEACRLHERSKEMAARVPVLQRQSYLSGIAYLAVLGGDARRALPETELAVQEVRAANVPRLLLSPLHNFGDLQLRSGDLDGAERAFREAIRLAATYGFDYHLHLNRGFLGYTLARKGEPQDGADYLAEAKTAMTQISGEHIALQQLRLLDAEVAHIMGDSARARRELEEMLPDFYGSNEIALAQWAEQALSRIEQDLGACFLETSGPSFGDTSPDVDTVRTQPVK